MTENDKTNRGEVLQGKRAVVIGGGRGIGAATAQRLAAVGVAVMLCLGCSVLGAMPDKQLNHALSAAIGAVIEDGRYSALYRRWFGVAPGNALHPLPPPCSQTFPDQPVGALKAALARGRLRFGFTLLGRPYSFAEGGVNTGWDLELATLLTTAIGEHYGSRLVAEPVALPPPFPDRLFAALDDGTIDAVLSDLAITEARAQQVDLTCGYLTVTIGLLRGTRDAERLPVARLEQANVPDFRLLVLDGSFLHGVANTYLPAATKLPVSDVPALYRGVEQGEGHATILPLAAIRAYLADPPPSGRNLSSPAFTIGPSSLRGIATRKPL